MSLSKNFVKKLLTGQRWRNILKKRKGRRNWSARWKKKKNQESNLKALPRLIEQTRSEFQFLSPIMFLWVTAPALLWPCRRTMRETGSLPRNLTCQSELLFVRTIPNQPAQCLNRLMLVKVIWWTLAILTDCLLPKPEQASPNNSRQS